MNGMNESVMHKMNEKIREVISHESETKHLLKSLSSIDSSDSFALGIVVGRLYNSFYYQSKRILNREPTYTEFDEFLKLIKDRKSDLIDLW